MTRLPEPEQWLLTPMSEAECAEMIERYVEYVDVKGDPVQLQRPYVEHYMRRDDAALPTVVTVSTLPVVLADGVLLAKRGLDRERGIAFVIPEELLKWIPRREDCTPEAVARAMRYLCDDWLCDVATDYVGKCVLIALALTLIERSLLPQRPAFFVTAGRRGGGKTTTLTMVIMGVTGLWPAAAAWSTDENERRKSLLSYFLEGVAYILWDNIVRGTQISCPHIEKSCTSAYYADRKLGVSEAVATAASAIHVFTGNNVGPRGDLASRSLQVRLAVDRADPENREFKHPDPVEWTESNRAEILQALYTILLGNPHLAAPREAPGKTRFKMWWRLVGSAVEHAAVQAALFENHEPLDFQKLFLGQEEDDEESATLADVLAVLERHWPEGAPFKARDVSALLNETQAVGDFKNEFTPNARELREVLFPNARHDPSTKSVGRRQKSHVDEPVRHGNRTLTLRSGRDVSGGSKDARNYYIEVKLSDEESS